MNIAPLPQLSIFRRPCLKQSFNGRKCYKLVIMSKDKLVMNAAIPAWQVTYYRQVIQVLCDITMNIMQCRAAILILHA